MIPEEEIRRYLPKYLSPESYQEILAELRGFPENLDKRMYSLAEDSILCQGDIIKDLPIIDLPHVEKGIKLRNAIILSNTCDIDLANRRNYPVSLVYAPLYELERFINMLRHSGVPESTLNNQICDIKKQKATSIIYFPGYGSMKESVALLDKVHSIDIRYIDRKKLDSIRLASLSNYGFYLFLFKLSVHFCRMQEGLDRKPLKPAV